MLLSADIPRNRLEASLEKMLLPEYQSNDSDNCLVSPMGGEYLTREVTGVCGKHLHTLYPVE